MKDKRKIIGIFSSFFIPLAIIIIYFWHRLTFFLTATLVSRYILVKLFSVVIYYRFHRFANVNKIRVSGNYSVEYLVGT